MRLISYEFSEIFQISFLWSNSEGVVGCTPPHGGLSPPPPLFPQNQSQIIKDNSKIIPTLIAFLKMFLGNVKVKILLISWHFLVVFCIRLPPAHSLTPSLLCKWTVLRWCICGPSFIYMWHKNLEFWYFKSSISSRKYHFRLLLGCFLDVPPPPPPERWSN